jgi:hypothetical protein
MYAEDLNPNLVYAANVLIEIPAEQAKQQVFPPFNGSTWVNFSFLLKTFRHCNAKTKHRVLKQIFSHNFRDVNNFSKAFSALIVIIPHHFLANLHINSNKATQNFPPRAGTS